MVIRRLKIKNFGKIRNRDMELIPGINVNPGKILPNMVGSCGLQVKERIIALQEIFIKKRKWENFSVKMTEALWMRNRELLSLFSEM